MNARKAKTRQIVTVVPTINHDRMRRGHRYDLVLTDDVARRVEAGALTIVDKRTEPILDQPVEEPAPASDRRVSARVGASTTSTDTEQEGDDNRHDDTADGDDD